MKPTRLFWLALYYGIARNLPITGRPLFGRPSGRLRNLCAQHLFARCGKRINIEHGTTFGTGAEVELGEDSSMGIHCHYPYNIKIGDNVLFGPHCHILSPTTHVFDRTDVHINAQGIRKITRPTVIEDDVWIGRQCIMIPGHKVGAHTVIGAGSVICKDVPSWSVAAGNPIRVIRDRRQPNKPSEL